MIDDLVLTRCDTFVYAVLNAGCAEKDLAHLEAVRAADFPSVTIETLDRALIALQGPSAADALQSMLPPTLSLSRIPAFTAFDTTLAVDGGVDAFVSRAGYTGEDGFEVSELYRCTLLSAPASAHDR